MACCLHKLNLTNFRNYTALRMDVQGAPFVVLTGENGAGKTNILEAVSLLTPGRGLRGADLLEIKNRKAGVEDMWAVAADVETASGIHCRIGTGLARDDKRRTVRIDGQEAATQSDLSNFVSAVWLTPQMDRLFLDGSSARRKFFDRLVYALDPAHGMRLNRHDKNVRERMALLQSGHRKDPRWLSQLETAIVEDAVAIASARQQLIDRLQSHVEGMKQEQTLFPAPVFVLEGAVEKALLEEPALAVEDRFKNLFEENRNIDAAAGRTHVGAHRSNVAVFYGAKDMPAAYCSTGEQKALLTAIILAYARMIRAEKGHMPILLLDEVAAHLDEARRQQLFSFLQTTNGQVWMTGTDTHVFRDMPNARYYTVTQGHATPLEVAVKATARVSQQ